MEAGRKAAEATDFPAVLRFSDGAGDERVVRINVRGATDALPPAAGDASLPLSEAGMNDMPLALALLFAFVGGLILNLMPCVFPILSMKALSLVRMGQTARREAQQSGLLYTAGILVAFAVAGGILVVLREAGQSVGWGVQMQFPLVNLGLALLMVAIALNLLGVFEFGVRAAGIGQSLTAGSERRGGVFHRAAGGCRRHTLHRAIHGGCAGLCAGAAGAGCPRRIPSLGCRARVPLPLG